MFPFNEEVSLNKNNDIYNLFNMTVIEMYIRFYKNGYEVILEKGYKKLYNYYI